MHYRTEQAHSKDRKNATAKALPYFTFYPSARQTPLGNDLHDKHVFDVRHLSGRKANPLPCARVGSREKKDEQTTPYPVAPLSPLRRQL
jgi:hypothetical protein